MLKGEYRTQRDDQAWRGRSTICRIREKLTFEATSHSIHETSRLLTACHFTHSYRVTVTFIIVESVTPSANGNFFRILHAVCLDVLTERNLADSKANYICLLSSHTMSNQLGENLCKMGSTVPVATDVNGVSW